MTRVVSIAGVVALLMMGSVANMVRAADSEPSLPPPGFDLSIVLSDPDRPVRRHQAPYAGDIVDVLTHVTPPQRGGKSRGKDADSVGEQIAEAGVSLAYLMATPNEGGSANREDGTSYKIALAKRTGGLVRVFCGGDYLTNGFYQAQRSNVAGDTSSYLKRLENELDGGVCAGVGEFGLLHFNKNGDQPVVRMRPTFQPVLDLIALVARKGAWLQVHAEPMEPDGTPHHAEAFGALALWFARHPDLRLILSHTAMTNAANARRMLAAYPNLMLTIKLVPRNENWQHLEPVVNRRGQLYQDWAQLFEDMPSRFMVGSDTKFANDKHGSGDKYPGTIALFRNVLGSLNSAAAQAIASGNARRLLK